MTKGHFQGHIVTKGVKSSRPGRPRGQILRPRPRFRPHKPNKYLAVLTQWNNYKCRIAYIVRFAVASCGKKQVSDWPRCRRPVAETVSSVETVHPVRKSIVASQSHSRGHRTPVEATPSFHASPNLPETIRYNNYIARNVLDCDQSNYSSRIIFSYIFKLEPNTNWIGWTRCRDMAIRNFPRCKVGRRSVVNILLYR